MTYQSRVGYSVYQKGIDEQLKSLFGDLDTTIPLPMLPSEIAMDDTAALVRAFQEEIAKEKEGNRKSIEKEEEELIRQFQEQERVRLESHVKSEEAPTLLEKAKPLPIDGDIRIDEPVPPQPPEEPQATEAHSKETVESISELPEESSTDSEEEHPIDTNETSSPQLEETSITQVIPEPHPEPPTPEQKSVSLPEQSVLSPEEIVPSSDQSVSSPVSPLNDIQIKKRETVLKPRSFAPKPQLVQESIINCSLFTHLNNFFLVCALCKLPELLSSMTTVGPKLLCPPCHTRLMLAQAQAQLAAPTPAPFIPPQANPQSQYQPRVPSIINSVPQPFQNIQQPIAPNFYQQQQIPFQNQNSFMTQQQFQGYPMAPIPNSMQPFQTIQQPIPNYYPQTYPNLTNTFQSQIPQASGLLSVPISDPVVPTHLVPVIAQLRSLIALSALANDTQRATISLQIETCRQSLSGVPNSMLLGMTRAPVECHSFP